MSKKMNIFFTLSILAFTTSCSPISKTTSTNSDTLVETTTNSSNTQQSNTSSVTSNTPEVHEHNVASWTVTKAATPNENGSRKGNCTICGKEIVEVLEYEFSKDDDYSSVHSDKITENEWKALYSKETLNNFTSCAFFNEGCNFHLYDGNNKTAILRMTSKDGNTQEYRSFIDNEFGGYYVYSNNSQIAYASGFSGSRDYGMVNLLVNDKIQMPDFTSFYSRFVYNDNTFAYEYHCDGSAQEKIVTNAPMENNTSNYSYAKIVIRNNHIVYAEYGDTIKNSHGVEEDRFSYKIAYYDYGKTVVQVEKREPSPLDYIKGMKTAVIKSKNTVQDGDSTPQTIEKTYYLKDDYAYEDILTKYSKELCLPFTSFSSYDIEFSKSGNIYTVDEFDYTHDVKIKNFKVTIESSKITAISFDAYFERSITKAEYIISKYNEEIVVPNPTFTFETMFAFDNVTYTTNYGDIYICGNCAFLKAENEVMQVDYLIMIDQVDFHAYESSFTKNGDTYTSTKPIVKSNNEASQIQESTYTNVIITLKDGFIHTISYTVSYEFYGEKITQDLSYTFSNYGTTQNPNDQY